MNSPGISIARVIDGMALSALNKLLGNDLLDTLAQLSESDPEPDQLRNIAKSLYAGSNPDTVKTANIRNQIIDALPREKANELCSRLSISQTGNIYDRLHEFEFGRQREKDELLLNFFGIVEPQIAPTIRSVASSEISPNYGLFPYQRDVVFRAIDALNSSPFKSLLHMPTGAGKTRTAMHIIARHLLNCDSTLVCWFANSAELLEQAADEIERCWGTLGDRSISIYRFWGDNDIELSTARNGVLVAGFAKMNAAYRRDPNAIIALGDRASLTIVDEAHQAIAPTYRSIIEAIHTKQPRNALLGLTATPGRTWDDVEADSELSDFFGREKITMTANDYSDPVSFLIAEGYLAKPQFRTLEFDGDFSDVSYSDGGELSKESLSAISENSERNYKIIATIEELMSRHKRIIVFGASVEHARMLAGVLTGRGHDSKVVTGQTPPATRSRLIKQFRSANPHPMVLCNFGVLTTGFDAPQTSSVVIARPTKSLVLYSQMVGRAIRGLRAGGNEEAEVVTVVDTSLPGFGSVTEAFSNWEDVWNEHE